MANLMEQLGVLITSHPKQQQYWEAGLGSWRDYPYYVLMGYDHTDFDNVPIDLFKPPVTETFVTGMPAGALGHFRGELRQLKMGGQILADKGFNYIYKTAADNTCYRWRKLAGLFETMKHHKCDMIICGTTQIFAKLDIFNKCMELWHDQMRAGGAELYLYSQIRAFDVKVHYEKGPFWNQLLGLVHVQGEHALNLNKNVMWSWIKGNKWTGDYKHRDLTPQRLAILTEENTDGSAVREKKETC